MNPRAPETDDLGNRIRMKQLASSLVALFASVTLMARAESSVLSAEASAFLRALPPNVQAQQTKAIRQALAGHPQLLADMRAERQRRATPMRSTETLKLTDETLAGCAIRTYEPVGQAPTQTLLYFHGGGWVLGSIDSCAEFCAQLALAAHLRVVAVDYRLAPEHRAPAAEEDGIRVAQALKTRYPESAFFYGGDSAGGHLALMTHQSVPASGLLLYYPVLSYHSHQRPSWQHFGLGYGLDADLMDAFFDAYGESSFPMERPSLKVPPTLLISAECDILADEAATFAQAHPTAIQRLVIPGATHLFITLPGQPQARQQSLQATVDWLRNK